MKKLLSLSFAMCLAMSAFSQSVPSKWAVKKFGISLGYDEDMIKDLEYSYILSTAKGLEDSQYADMDYAPTDMYGGVCENPNLRLDVTLGVPGMKNMDLNLAFLGVFNRYDGVYYNNYDYQSNDFDWDNDLEYMSINSYGSELGLEVSMVKNLNFLRIFNIHGGLGTNVGYAIGHEVNIDGMNQGTVLQDMDRPLDRIVMGQNNVDEYYYDTFDGKDGISQRAFVTAGMGITFFKRVELGLDYRGGIGYRKTFGTDSTKMTKLNGVSLYAKWVLK